MKGILVEIPIEKSSKSAVPPVKARLEQASKKPKEYTIENLKGKLEHAESLRKTMKEFKIKRLHSLTVKKEEKIMRRYSYERNDLKEQKEKLICELKEAEQRRNQRLNKLKEKLQANNEKVSQKSAETNKKKSEKTLMMKLKMTKKLEGKEAQRAKLIDEKVQKLDKYNSKVSNIAKENKMRNQMKTKEIANDLEKKQDQAKENRTKHIEGVKSVAEKCVKQGKCSAEPACECKSGIAK